MLAMPNLIWQMSLEFLLELLAHKSIDVKRRQSLTKLDSDADMSWLAFF